MAGGRGRGVALSLLTVLLCTAAVVFAGRLRRQEAPLPFAHLAEASAEEAEEAYAASGAPEDLVYLLKVLCCKAEETGEADAEEKIAAYGTELLTLAKEGTVDLEALGETDGTLLELLRLIRGYGAA